MEDKVVDRKGKPVLIHLRAKGNRRLVDKVKIVILGGSSTNLSNFSTIVA